MEPTLRSAQVLKQEAEDLGFEGKEILDYVKDQQKLDREERAEWRKIRMAELQGEDKKRADEIRIAQIGAEAEEKKRADEIRFAQIEAAKEQAKIQAEKELALKELELKAQQSQAGASLAATPPPRNKDAKSPKLPSFIDEKDELDSYLLRFERYAENASWEKDTWAIKLSALLTGRAMDVYTRMSDADASDYDKLKKALLTRYNYTEDGYRKRFREATPETEETPDQFVIRLKNYLAKWLELSGSSPQNFDALVDLIVKEQFINACSEDLAMYLLERGPKDLVELTTWAQKYLIAHKEQLGKQLEKCVAGPVVTRAQAKKSDKVHPLKVKEAMSSVDKSTIENLQKKDSTLKKCFDRIGKPIIRENYVGEFYKKNGLLYRKHQETKTGRSFNQLVVPKELRRQVMSVNHESAFSGHLGAKKTEVRILPNFFWPGLRQDVIRFCRSCDVCQRTVKRGSVRKVPLGSMPLIDTPFKRVAVDIVGPIAPPSEAGHRYILTLVDYATRYPEAVPLKKNTTEAVAEALLDIYSRVGIPEEVLTDQGTQFMSECMQEVSRLLSIKGLTSTPYHPICNGLVERWNGTLKSMLKRLCQDQPKQWHRLINPVLFAYREVPQESTGFSPFQLLYGRSVRGPGTILKELWTKEVNIPEVKSSYEYVTELQERLEDSLKLAQEELEKSQKRYKRHYDRKAKPRRLEVGDRVLILLPTDSNKLLMQWRGPYTVESRVGANDYRVKMGSKTKTYHVNILKKYISREPEGNVVPVDDTDGATVAVAGVIHQDVDPELGEVPDLEGYRQREGVRDVKLGDELPEDQRRELKDLVRRYRDVFTDMPGETDVIQHQIRLSDDTPIRCKPYPLPYAMREELRNEVDTMLEMGVVRPSTSPYASPIIMVKKKDGSNRVCVDFRKLNKITEVDPEPMMTAEDLFRRLSGKKYLSKIDLTKGYWQIPVAPEDVHKTALVTPDGQYEFMRMPFGMVNSGATLVRGLRKILEGMPGVGSYVDDIVIYSDSWEDERIVW